MLAQAGVTAQESHPRPRTTLVKHLAEEQACLAKTTSEEPRPFFPRPDPDNPYAAAARPHAPLTRLASHHRPSTFSHTLAPPPPPTPHPPDTPPHLLLAPLANSRGEAARYASRAVRWARRSWQVGVALLIFLLLVGSVTVVCLLCLMLLARRTCECACQMFCACVRRAKHVCLDELQKLLSGRDDLDEGLLGPRDRRLQAQASIAPPSRASAAHKPRTGSCVRHERPLGLLLPLPCVQARPRVGTEEWGRGAAAASNAASRSGWSRPRVSAGLALGRRAPSAPPALCARRTTKRRWSFRRRPMHPRACTRWPQRERRSAPRAARRR